MSRTTAPEGEPATTTDRLQTELTWPYLARVLAACFVVAIHVVALPVGLGKKGTSAWWIAAGLDSSARWSVPVFIMLSGALVLAPRRAESVASFYRRRLQRVGIPLVVWSVAYLMFRRLYLGEHLGVRSMATDIALGIPFHHLYFLYVIVGLYALVPFLRVLVAHSTQRQLTGLTVAALVVPTANSILGAYLGTASTPVGLTYFLKFLGYFLAGYVLREVVLTRGLAILAALAVAVIVAFETITLAWKPALWALDYNSPHNTAMSLLVFLLFVQVGRVWPAHGRTTAVMRHLSDATFGVYLVHPMVLRILERNVLHYPAALPHTRQMAIALVATIACSFIVSAALRRIPFVRGTV